MAAPLLIGAALGLGKNLLIDRPREERQRELRKAIAPHAGERGDQPARDAYSPAGELAR